MVLEICGMQHGLELSYPRMIIVNIIDNNSVLTALGITQFILLATL